MNNIIFIHGLESSGKGFKGQLFKKLIPDILTPNFKEYNKKITIHSLLNDRMKQLYSILKKKGKWIIIGSSFGGLMATLYALQYPNKVKKLILLAPYLAANELLPSKYHPLEIPVIIYHGKNDFIVPFETSRERAKQFFKNLEYKLVDDDHKLHKTVKNLAWKILLKSDF